MSLIVTVLGHILSDYSSNCILKLSGKKEKKKKENNNNNKNKNPPRAFSGLKSLPEIHVLANK